jgi:hypothetical protein
MTMKRFIFVLAAASAFGPAFAQDREDERAERAYKRGYEEGFERGYQKGLREGERRAAEAAPPPPPAPAPPPRSGPIRVTGAFYGTTSRNCDATRFVASRANGKRSFSFEVTNEICGDPARGDRKSLEVTYRCGEILKSTSANEHRTIYLDCR